MLSGGCKNIDVKEVTVKSNRDARFKSFRVTINRKDLKLVLNKAFWPYGVGCKVWKDFDRKTFKTINFIGSRYK